MQSQHDKRAESDLEGSRGEQPSLDRGSDSDSTNDPDYDDVKTEDQKKLQIKPSKAWTYFDKIAGLDRVARCQLCSEQLSYRTAVSNLLKHLKCRHPNVGQEQACADEEAVPDPPDCTEERDRTPKSYKKRSSLWMYFDTIEGSDRMAECMLCRETLSYRGSVSNLRKHLSCRHANLVLEQHTADADPLDCAEKGETPERRRQRSGMWQYFEKIDERGELARCAICLKELSYRSTTANLTKHLQRKHPSVLPRPEHPAETEEEQPMEEEPARAHDTTTRPSLPRRDRRKTSKMWNYFTITDKEKCMARCNLCLKELSYRSSISNLRKHLTLMHFKMTMDENPPQLQEEFLDEDVLQEASSSPEPEIFKTTDISKTRTTQMTCKRKRPRTPQYFNSESHDRRTGPSPPSQHENSIDTFGKYITTLMKTLPEDIAMKLQADIVMQVINAQIAHRPQPVNRVVLVPATSADNSCDISNSDQVVTYTIAPS